MNVVVRLLRSTRAAAAAEMALITPLLLTLAMGSAELGNYFYNEHILIKAVRDGARFAGRQPFDKFACSGTPTVDSTVVTNTKIVVMTGLLSGGSNRLANWNASSIMLSLNCYTATGGQSMLGIYRNSTGASAGAPIVTVSATVPYIPVLKSFGFSGIGLNLNARQQAAVMGI